jgi:sec-independent protein translocase protein TatA
MGELIVILLIAVLLFGGKKLSGVGKALGQSIREFKDEVKSTDKEESKEETEKKDA